MGGDGCETRPRAAAEESGPRAQEGANPDDDVKAAADEAGAVAEDGEEEGDDDDDDDDTPMDWEAVASAAALACPMEVKRVAAILLGAIDNISGMAEAVGRELKAALEHMHEAGAPVAVELLSKLQGWMAAVVELLSDEDLEELQQAVTTAVSFGVEELGALWGWLGQAIDAAILAGRELVKVVLPSIASAAVMTCQEQLKNLARFLLDAINSLPELAAAVGSELKEGLQSMYETGAPVAAKLFEDLKGSVSALVDWLSDVDVERLQRAVVTAVSLGIEEVGAFYSWLGDAVDQAIEGGRDLVKVAMSAMASSAAMARVEELKNLARCLLDAIENVPGMAEAVASDLKDGLHVMYKTGAPVAAKSLEQLRGWFDKIVAWLSDVDVERLQRTVNVIIAFGVDQFAALSAWLAEAVDKAIAAGRQLLKVAKPVLARAAALAYREEIKSVARYLLDAVKSIPDAATYLAADVKEGLQRMYDTGVPIAARLLAPLRGLLGDVVAWLRDVDVERFQRAISLAVALGAEALASLRDWFAEAVEKAIEGGRQLVQLAAPVIASAAEFARAEELKNLAKYLLDALQSIPGKAEQAGQDLVEALREMYATGKPIAAELFAKLQGSFSAIVAWLSDVDVERFQRTVNNLVALGVEGLGALWSWLGEAVGEAIESGRELVKVNMPTMAVAAFKACQEELKNLAKLLLDALDDLPDLAAAAGKAVRDGLRTMYKTGAPLAAELLAKLKGWLDKIVAWLSDDAVERVQHAVSMAASAGMDGFRAFWAWLSEAVDKAIEEGRALVKVVLPVVQESTALVVDSLEDIYNSDEVQCIIGTGFGVLSDAYTMSARALAEAMQALQGIAAGCCGYALLLLKLEIWRDFMQTVGTMFSKLFSQASTGLVKFAQSFWGAIFNFFTADLYAVVQSESFQQAAIAIAIVLASLCFVAYVVLLCYTCRTASDELREGHEVVTWKERVKRERKTTQVATWVLTLCLSSYLPVSSTAVSVVHCSPQVADSLPSGGFFDCRDGAVLYIAWVLLALFTIPFPIMCIYAIWKNKPRGSILDPNIAYDEDGEEVAFDDWLYLERVENDPDQVANPYRSLYRGFERKWAWYKVVQLLIKLMLAVPAIVIADKTLGSGICCCFYLVFCIASLCMTPFLEAHNDVMDIGARAVALITCLGALSLSLAGSDGSDALGMGVGLAVNLMCALNVALMAALVLMHLGPVERWTKNRFGVFDFRDTCTNRRGPAPRIVPTWDLGREVKHRIWHSFWDGVLLNACGTEVAERNLELRMDTRNYGYEKIKAHWQGERDPAVHAARLFARRELEGVDLYWNGGWGKVWIDDYPFHMFVVYDDSSEVDVLWARDDVLSFQTLQLSKSVSRRRRLRQKLRALSRSAASFSWPFSRWEVIRCADGYEYDEEKKTRRQLYSDVSFLIKYNRCTVHVATSDDWKPMAAGFYVSCNYNDGCGHAVLPRTGQWRTVSGRSASMPASHIGVYGDFEPNPTNARVLRKTRSAWRPQLASLLREAAEYRLHLVAEREEANKVLSDGFWFNVYNDESVALSRLCFYLMTQERNPILNAIPKHHGAGLNFVYKRLQFCRCHPSLAVWYCFWDELWSSNGDMDVLKPLGEEINPFSGKSVAYTPMPREKLEAWLRERKLLGAESDGCGCCKPRLVAARDLDTLYARMAAESESARQGA